MSGSGAPGTLSVMIRATEGLALLALSGVILAVSFLAERRAVRAEKIHSRSSRALARAR